MLTKFSHSLSMLSLFRPKWKFAIVERLYSCTSTVPCTLSGLHHTVCDCDCNKVKQYFYNCNEEVNKVKHTRIFLVNVLDSCKGD